MEFLFQISWLLILGHGSYAAAETNFGNVLAKLDHQFLHEDATGSPSTKQGPGHFSGVFCDENDPLCQKFQGVLQGTVTSDDDKEIRFHSSIDETDVHNDEQAVKIPSDGGAIPEDQAQNTFDMEPMKFDCEENNPVCQEFQAMLKYDYGSSEAFPAQGFGTDKDGPPKRPSSGSTSQTPWCEFYCQYFLSKICYSDGTCGDAVNEETKP